MKVSRRMKKPVRIEMLPLIDIVFLLLIFFIYAMLSMAVHRGLQLDLPESSTAAVSKKSPLSISMKKEKEMVHLFLNKTQLSHDALRKHLCALQSVQKEDPVFVFADEQVSYQQLYEVLDLLRDCGIDEISLQANQE